MEKDSAIAQAEREDEEAQTERIKEEARQRALEFDRQQRRQHLNAWRVLYFSLLDRWGSGALLGAPPPPQDMMCFGARSLRSTCITKLQDLTSPSDCHLGGRISRLAWLGEIRLPR